MPDDAGDPLLDPQTAKPPNFEQIFDQIAAGFLKRSGNAAMQWLIEPLLQFVAILLASIFTVIDPIALALGNAFLEAFGKAAAGPLGTLLSLATTEFKEAIKGEGGKMPTGGAGAEIGGLFVDRIVGATPESDEWGVSPSIEPAKDFVGMMAEVGLRGWALDLLAELESAGFIHAFEDLIGIIVRTIGFGRLSRVALRPIIETTIGAPATSYVQKRWRPKLLSEGLAAKAVLREDKDSGWLEEELGRQGYAGDRISAIVADSQKYMPLELVDRLVRNARLGPDAFVFDAMAQGYNRADANSIKQAFALQRADAQATKVLDAALVQVHDGIISEGQFSNLVNTIGIPPDEAAFWDKILGIRMTFPRKSLTIGELNECFQKNIVHPGEYRSRLEKLGYGEEDAILMETLQQQIVHDKESAAAAKKAIQEQRAADKAAAKAKREADAAQRKADLLARRQQQHDFLLAKQKAAADAAVARIQFTQDAIVQRHSLIDQAQQDKLLTQGQADQAKAQLATFQAEHTAQANAHSQQMAALDSEQTAIETAALDQTGKAAAVAQQIAAAKLKASIDQQILDAKRADRIAGYGLARESAQASFAAGEITAKDLAKKLRTIDLQEAKDAKAEDVAQLQIERGVSAAEQTAAAGAIALENLKAKATIAPAATARRQHAIAATLADHVQVAADVGSTRVRQLADLTTRKVHAADAANARRDALDQQLAQQRIELERQIEASKPPLPPVTATAPAG